MSKGLALCMASPPRGLPARVVQDGLSSAERHADTYLAAVDLAKGYRVSQVLETAGRLTAKDHTPKVTKTKLCQKTHEPTDTASHEIIGNFMTKMTKLLKTTLGNQRGEQTQNNSNDKALE
ncbi:hypothetical protein M9H77_03418 [Catharanthus roseus]|uniref:Uncharacterized protein n=1 Tax=Catharanthus roseus TaxID=4058 RepID=A0ACC0CB86_CATRO|nr:hypothetical protein M9H77_03418 [Catharanthus roseus]